MVYVDNWDAHRVCAGVQVDRLQLQLAELQDQLQEQAEAAALREQQARLEVQAAAEERLDIQLQQQQLKYERQIQVRMQPARFARVDTRQQQLLTDPFVQLVGGARQRGQPQGKHTCTKHTSWCWLLFAGA